MNSATNATHLLYVGDGRWVGARKVGAEWSTDDYAWEFSDVFSLILWLCASTGEGDDA